MAGTSERDRSSELNRRREKLHSQRADDHGNLLKLLKEDDFSDITLVCSDGKEFRSYKMILASTSSYFSSMFRRSFREASSDRVLLQSIDSRTMGVIMKYIGLDFEDYEAFETSCRPFVADVLRASHMLDLSGLVRLSAGIFGEQITYDNYVEAWQFYATFGIEALKEHLRTSFRRFYREFLYEKVYLTFDPRLMVFALRQWMSFLDHKLMAKVIVRWVEAAPEQRERSLVELTQLLRKDRIPSGFVEYLSCEEKILQRHPGVLERFKTSAPVAVDSTQFETKEEVLADSLSVLVFRRNRTVQRLYFSGRKEEKVLPLDSDLVRSDGVVRACVEYKSKLYILRQINGGFTVDFFEYDYDTNSCVSIAFSPILARRYEAFVFNDKVYVHCPVEKCVQCYDLKTSGAWRVNHLMDVPDGCMSLCPYKDTILTLRRDDVGDYIQVATLERTFTTPLVFQTVKFCTIPCCKLFLSSIIVHCGGRLYGFSNHSEQNAQFIYDMDDKCLKRNVEPSTYTGRTCLCTPDNDFQRISTLQRHPLILKYGNRSKTCTLFDFEIGIELGRVTIEDDWCFIAPYCNGVTL